MQASHQKILQEIQQTRLQKLAETQAEIKRIKALAEQDVKLYKQKMIEETGNIKADIIKEGRKWVNNEYERIIGTEKERILEGPASPQRYASLKGKSPTKSMLEQKKLSARYNEAITITQDDIDEQCVELFRQLPIKFEPRPANKLEERLNDLLVENDITTPIRWLKGNMYFVGIEKVNFDLKADNIIVRTGGGYEQFTKWMLQNQRHHQRVLINHMINNDQSLEWVFDQLA